MITDRLTRINIPLDVIRWILTFVCSGVHSDVRVVALFVVNLEWATLARWVGDSEEALRARA